MTPAFWYELTDYALFPHLQLFASAAELVQGLLSANLQEISSNMAEFNAETWRHSSAFYRAAFNTLMVAAEGGEIGAASATISFVTQPDSADAWAVLCQN